MSGTVFCCSCLGLFSILGVFFYTACAIMIYNRNMVFIEKKMELDFFTITDEDMSNRLWTLIYVIFVSRV